MIISVVIPVYNAENTISMCLDSIISQTYKNLEIICVNDGSIDDSLRILKEYKKIDNRIKIINKENSGVSDTRNVGIDNCNGNYIAFVDSDDYIESNMIELMYNAIVKNKVDVVRCNANIWNKNGKKYNEDMLDLSNKKLNSTQIKNNIFRFVTTKKTIGCYTPLLMISKKKQVKFNTKLYFMEDTDFYVRLLLNCDHIYFLDKNIYNYRYNSVSSSKNINKCLNNIYGIIDSTNNIKSVLKEKDLLSNELIKEMNYSILTLIISKIIIYSDSGFGKTLKLIKKIFTDFSIRNIILNVNVSSLPVVGKFKYICIKYNLYVCLLMYLFLIKIINKVR